MSKEKRHDEKTKQDCEKRKEDNANPTNARGVVLAQIRRGVKLRHAESRPEDAEKLGNNGDRKSQSFVDELDKNFKSSENNTKRETREEYAARIEREQKERRERQRSNTVNSNIAQILKRRVAIEPSHSEDEYKNDGYTSDDEWDKDKDECQRNLDLQQNNKKRSKSPDSGHGSDGDTKPEPKSPSHSVPKGEKQLISPEPTPEAPPLTEVSNKSSTKLEKYYDMFGGRAQKCQVQSVIDQGKSKLVHSS